MALPPPLPLPSVLTRPVDHWVHGWAVASQQRARRNAMVAATALTQRRAEALEVEVYLASTAVRRQPLRHAD